MTDTSSLATQFNKQVAGGFLSVCWVHDPELARPHLPRAARAGYGTWICFVRHMKLNLLDASVKNALRQLIDIGAADPMECQNSSPSIGYFLKELEPFKEKVKLIGYVIYPPRSDARVSVEGFDIFGITADEADAMMDKFRSADETDKVNNGELYDLHFWWD